MFAFFVVYLYFGPAAAPGTRGSRRDVLSPRVCVKGCEMYKKQRRWTSTVRAKKYSEIKLDLSWIQSQGQSLRASGGPSRGSRVLDWFLNLPFEYGISTFDSESFEPRSHWESSGHLISITSLTTTPTT